MTDAPLVVQRPTLTWRGARAAADAAVAKAGEEGVNIVVVVVDKGAHPVVVIRMDGASPGHARAAEAKARGAVNLGRSTADFLEYVKKDEDLYRAILSAGDMFLVGGGDPLVVDGHTVGAIGVSGARYVQDMVCATAGQEAFHRLVT
jgi:glc operon protein GlcG